MNESPSQKGKPRSSQVEVTGLERLTMKESKAVAAAGFKEQGKSRIEVEVMEVVPEMSDGEVKKPARAASSQNPAEEG